MKTESVRVGSDVLNKARKHCEENGVVLTWYISQALKEKLEKENK